MLRWHSTIYRSNPCDFRDKSLKLVFTFALAIISALSELVIKTSFRGAASRCGRAPDHRKTLAKLKPCLKEEREVRKKTSGNVLLRGCH